ncbi:MAG TPA: DUF131 domain-containing protein [Methanothrix sp.]|nr:DUF131 domain-containing protein [Methanothrix sp.]
MLLLALGAVLILLGFLMLIWPRTEQKDCANDAQRQNQNREIRDQGRRRQRTETQETIEDSRKRDKIEHTHVKGGALVMIGPIPIVMGSDPRIALFMMIIALAVMILWALTVKGN